MGHSCGCCQSREDCTTGLSLTDSYGLHNACSSEGSEFDTVDGKRRSGNRKGNRIGSRISGSDLDPTGEEHLVAHRKPRGKGTETKRLIMTAMKQDRVCAMLGDMEITTILDTMEYFEFQSQDVVVLQGDVGTTFFVTHDGTMEVCVGGRVVNTLSRGRAFGGLALLYNCPRTASVTATSSSSAWGANGRTFHKVLQENAKKSHAENRLFLDSMRLFDGLTVKQKDRISEAFFVEVFNPGSRVVTEGEASTAMYSVKQGELKLMENVSINDNGEVSGGDVVGSVSAGECFGERALLCDELQTQTVVAGERSEALVISRDNLREVFGNDLKTTFEHAFVLSGVKMSLVLSQFTTAQQTVIAQAIEVEDYNAGFKVPAGLRFVLICEGEVTGRSDGMPVELGRGTCWEWDVLIDRSAPALISTTKTLKAMNALASLDCEKRKAAMTDLTVGADGARLGTLSDEVLRRTLESLGLKFVDDTAGAEEDFTRKMILVKKVRIFRHLAQEALEKLVEAFILEKFKKGESVIKQGQMGNKFFVIASGEVGVSIGGKFIRTMPRNQFFGERALLFDEPRTATVQVSTNEAEFWSIEKTIFKQLITVKMQEELIKKIRLQDTSVTLKDLQMVQVIGFGAEGVVRLVEHKKNQTRYALKRVHKVDGAIPDVLARECELLAENDHPFIMTLVKTFETAKDVYMLTELITGGELHTAIRTIPTVLSRSQCQFYGGCLLLVLEELADRNILYRDMKPENVMLDQQGYLKLIDFGIAKKLQEGNTRTFTMIGTPQYMAPEVMRGHGYGTEVDIWSLGVMIFEFVCGALPFAEDLDDPFDICAAVLKDPLTFPTGFKDAPGRTLIGGMLKRSIKNRLGCGLQGYEDIKSTEYFQAGHEGSSVFNKILGRELEPPVVPSGERYAPPEEDDCISLDDACELG